MRAIGQSDVTSQYGHGQLLHMQQSAARCTRPHPYRLHRLASNDYIEAATMSCLYILIDCFCHPLFTSSKSAFSACDAPFYIGTLSAPQSEFYSQSSKTNQPLLLPNLSNQSSVLVSITSVRPDQNNCHHVYIADLADTPCRHQTQSPNCLDPAMNPAKPCAQP